MKLIIDIDEREYKIALKRKENFPRDLSHFENIIANGKPYQDWIPVSEMLPEKNVWVLVTVEQSGVRHQEIMRRNNFIDTWTDNIDNYNNEITAWMPLPEPYRKEGVENE